MTSDNYSRYLRLDIYVLKDAICVQLVLAVGGEVQVVVVTRLGHHYHHFQPSRLSGNTLRSVTNVRNNKNEFQ